MKSKWIANYHGTEIKVENTWFNGERLFVNGKLQDEKLSFFSADLSGHLINSTGEKPTIKVNISGFVKISCRLFVNDSQVELKQVE
jgi:hypothetical protein